MSIYDLREKLISKELNEQIVPKNPFNLFITWYEEAKIAKIFEPHAFALATVGKDSQPAVRMLLLKSIENESFVFFTNYNSNKGKQLAVNPKAAMVFYWTELERQVRISGLVEKLKVEESDKYFESRPIGSRLGAWASPQSQVIENRKWLEEKHLAFRQQFNKGIIPRPENWGGYRLRPHIIEFWQGRPNRLHDRIEYYLDDNNWKIRRLAP